jgi:hypothetical protein
MVIVSAVGAAAIAVAFFWAYSDHSWASALHWALFYVVGLGIPLRWSFEITRTLRDLNVPFSGRVRMIPLYPVLAGLITMAIALSLIREAVLAR